MSASPVITDSDREAFYTATASQDTFDYPFWVENSEDLAVYTDGIPDVEGVDYTVTDVQQDNGSTIVFTTPKAGGEKVAIIGQAVIDRVTGFTGDNGSFTTEALNLEFARMITILQENHRDLARTVRLSPFSTTDPAGLTCPEPVEGRGLKWESGALVNTSFALDDVIPQAITSANAAAISAAEADADAASAAASASSASTSATDAAASAASAAAIVVGSLVIPVVSNGSGPVALGAADKAQLFQATAAGITYNLDDPAVLGNGWYVFLAPYNGGATYLMPAGGGTLNGQSSITLFYNQLIMIFCDGANFRVLGIPETASAAITRQGLDTVKALTPSGAAAVYGKQGVDLASASTVTLPSTPDGNYHTITGTTTINSFGSPSNILAGYQNVFRFSGSLQLTYNATSMILPGAANIQTKAGDVAFLRYLGSGNWICVAYQRAAIAPPLEYTDETGSLQTVTTGATLTWTHGLGGIPKAFDIYYKCINADAGYSVGEVIKPETAVYDGITSQTAYGYTAKMTSTQIIAYVTNGFIGNAVNPSTKNMTNLTSGKWAAYIHARR